MKEEANRDFNISVKTLEKEFLCNICFNEIDDCFITRCGHIYCRKCIYESINRHHRCPFCNIDLTQNDVFKNFHFNTLRKIVNKEKQEAAHHYLQKVFAEQEAIESALMGPVEKQIISTMKEALLAYRKFIKDSFEEMQKSEEKKATQLGDSRIRNTSEIIQDIHKLVLPYMKSPIISPLLIPQNVMLHLQLLPPLKNIPISLELTSMTPVLMIVSTFEKHLQEANIRLEYNVARDKVKVVIGEFIFGLDDLIGQAILKLGGSSVPVIINGIVPARNIECYSYKWKNGKAVNYYTCKECNINWVCEVCKDYCHQGHTHVLQLKDHTPNWACCYCATKCDCKALNKNSPQ